MIRLTEMRAWVVVMDVLNGRVAVIKSVNTPCVEGEIMMVFEEAIMNGTSWFDVSRKLTRE